MTRRLAVLLGGEAMAALVLAVAGITGAQTAQPTASDDRVAVAAAEDPRIRSISPKPGSETRDRTPTIKAKVTDNDHDLEKRDIKLKLDGDRIRNFDFSRGRDVLEYTPNNDLSTAKHTVKVVAVAAQGEKASERWSFRIRSAEAATATLVGAGDIASCSSSGDEATAALVKNIPGTVFTTGDNAYPDGTAEDFDECYAPSWGAFKDRTRPSPGNHDYNTANAQGYRDYFGAAATNPNGKTYYTYRLGDWRIYVLDSQIPAGTASSQYVWLAGSLSTYKRQCMAAYWHYPIASSGPHGNTDKMRPIFKLLDNNGADLVLAGHDHGYERFARINSTGAPDPNGMREFVVGTGGGSHYRMQTAQPGSQVRNSDTYGVLKLTLNAGSYTWKFVPVAGKTFTDSGTDSC